MKYRGYYMNMKVSIIVSCVVVLLVSGTSVYSLPAQCSCTFNTQGEVTAVDCSNGNLTSVPSDIPATVNKLTLHNNSISVIPNNTFKKLSLLQNLDLSFNEIHRLEVNVFSGLKSLQVLDLASNRLILNNESYPGRVFVDLQQLKVLKINNNTKDTGSSRSHYPDEALSHVTNMRELYIDGLALKSLGEGFRELVHLEVLDFNGNTGYCGFVNITEHKFANIRTRSPLTLNMSQCYIRDAHPSAFSFLPTLEVLDLENNGHFQFQAFMVASQSFPNTSIKVLNISTINRVHLMNLNGKYFQHLRKTKLTEIVIKSNRVYCVDPLAIRYLPWTLEHLSLRDNKLLDGNFLLDVLLKFKLETLDIGRQLKYNRKQTNMSPSSFSLPDTSKDYCRNSWLTHVSMVNQQPLNSYRENLDVLDKLNSTPCDPVKHSEFPTFHSFPHDIPLPRSLHTLYGDWLHLGYAIPKATFKVNNKLRFLNLSSDSLYCFGGPIYGLHHLEVLDLSNNHCNDVNPLFFIDMPGLTHLHLRDNRLGQALSSDIEGKTFSSQTKLKFLGLRNNQIDRLPENIFMNLHNLEHLTLGENSFSSFEARIGHMKKLNALDLSKNEFVGLSQDLCNDLDRISKFNTITVDLRNNTKLQCDCSTFNFVHWITETSVLIKDFNSTSCRLGNMSVVYFPQLKNMLPSLWLECHTQTIFTVVLAMFVCLVVFMGLCGIVYYKRWRLKYLFYIGRRRVNPFNSLGNPVPTERMLDVFISYDEDDIKWRTFIQQVLLARLEEEHVSCLVSEIHFLCGRNMREIIEEAVLGTKMTLALLSNDFFKSRDRELEFNMAVLHGMETRQDILLPVAMETLEHESIPPEVRTFLKANPPLQYSEDDPEFWVELLNRIKSFV